MNTPNSGRSVSFGTMVAVVAIATAANVAVSLVMTRTPQPADAASPRVEALLREQESRINQRLDELTMQLRASAAEQVLPVSTAAPAETPTIQAYTAGQPIEAIADMKDDMRSELEKLRADILAASRATANSKSAAPAAIQQTDALAQSNMRKLEMLLADMSKAPQENEKLLLLNVERMTQDIKIGLENLRKDISRASKGPGPKIIEEDIIPPGRAMPVYRPTQAPEPTPGAKSRKKAQSEESAAPEAPAKAPMPSATPAPPTEAPTPLATVPPTSKPVPKAGGPRPKPTSSN